MRGHHCCAAGSCKRGGGTVNVLPVFLFIIFILFYFLLFSIYSPFLSPPFENCTSLERILQMQVEVERGAKICSCSGAKPDPENGKLPPSPPQKGRRGKAPGRRAEGLASVERSRRCDDGGRVLCIRSYCSRSLQTRSRSSLHCSTKARRCCARSLLSSTASSHVGA